MSIPDSAPRTFGYFQIRPYERRYRVYRSPLRYGTPLAEVYRVREYWWEAARLDPPGETAYATGRTRDEAVRNLFAPVPAGQVSGDGLD